MPYALCRVPCALCPMPYALCPMPCALCPMPSTLCPMICSTPHQTTETIENTPEYRVSETVCLWVMGHNRTQPDTI
jgi:hypothetical protein